MIKKPGAEKFAFYVRNSSPFVSLEDRQALRKILEKANSEAVWAPNCPDIVAQIRALASADQPSRLPTRAPHSRAQKKDW